MDNDINMLIKAVESRFGHTPLTPTDFNRLIIEIETATGETVSLSTLKRMWGYVTSPHIPSVTVRSILARYTGYSDWNDFCRGNADSDSTDYFGVTIVRTSDLKPGDTLTLTWAPDRVCCVRYSGELRFKVIASRNCKLRVDDTFSCSALGVGQPMFAFDIRRGDKIVPAYVAARSRGLSSVTVNSPEID